jgi:amidohydrolase
MVDFIKAAQDIKGDIVDWRRDFHKHPELSFEEVRTAGIIAEHLRSLNIETQTEVGKTGVIGTIKGDEDGPTIMLRFDIDALPIQEEADLDFAFKGTVKLFFQPAEEVAGGAQAMIDDGALDDLPDMCFGVHVHSRTPIGEIKIEPGPILSAADMFKFTVFGKGGHGAEPQDTIDPIAITAQIINNIQMIVSRNVSALDMAVVSVGSIHAGEAPNVIPDCCKVSGNIRTYLPETRKKVHQRIQQIVAGIAETNGATSEFEMIYGIPATVNDPKLTAELIPVLENIVGVDKIGTDERSTPSDDMALFMEKVPGVYFVVGAGGEDYFPHHNPKFAWDDSVLPLSAGIMAEIVAHFSTNYSGK